MVEWCQSQDGLTVVAHSPSASKSCSHLNICDRVLQIHIFSRSVILPVHSVLMLQTILSDTDRSGPPRT